jgi:hypothetical protein
MVLRQNEGTSDELAQASILEREKNEYQFQ